MANVVEIVLSAVDANLASGLAEAQTQAEGLGGALGALGPMALGAAAAAAPLVTAFLLKDAIDNTEQLAESVHKLSLITGDSAEGASKLAYALNVVGPGADAGAVAISRLENNIAKNSTTMDDGSVATKGIADKLADLGVHLNDASGQAQSGTAIFSQMADVFASMPDGPEKTSLAIQAFGRSGAALIPVLDQGSAGLQKMGDDAQALGVVMSGATLESLHNSEIAGKEFGQAMEGLQVVIGEAVLPVLAGLAEKVIAADEAFQKADGLKNFLGTVIQGIPGVAGFEFVMDKLKQGATDQGSALDKLSTSQEQSTAETQKMAQAQETAAGIIDRANEAAKKGYGDVADALNTAAADIVAGHDLEAKSAERMASEETKAHQEAEAAAKEHARQEQQAWDDIHSASMAVINDKPIEAEAYQKAAALEAQGYGDLAKAAIQSGQEQQTAADKAAQAADQAAKKQEAAAKQAAQTYQQEVDAAQTAQGQIEGVFASMAKTYTDDENKLMTALDGKHDKTVAEAQAELASVQEYMHQQFEVVAQAIANVEQLKQQETQVMSAEDRKQLTSAEQTAQGQLTAAQNAYNEASATATSAQAVIDAANKKAAADAKQAIQDQFKDQEDADSQSVSSLTKALSEQQTQQTAYLKWQHDEFEASTTDDILVHKRGLDKQQQDLEDLQNQEKETKEKYRKEEFDLDAQIDQAEIALNAAKFQMEFDLQGEELSLKLAADQAKIQSSGAVADAETLSAQQQVTAEGSVVTAVGAVADASTQTANEHHAQIPQWLQDDEAKVQAAQGVVDKLQGQKAALIDAAQAADHAAQQAIQDENDKQSAITKTTGAIAAQTDKYQALLMLGISAQTAALQAATGEAGTGKTANGGPGSSNPANSAAIGSYASALGGSSGSGSGSSAVSVAQALGGSGSSGGGGIPVNYSGGSGLAQSFEQMGMPAYMASALAVQASSEGFLGQEATGEIDTRSMMDAAILQGIYNQIGIGNGPSSGASFSGYNSQRISSAVSNWMALYGPSQAQSQYVPSGPSIAISNVSDIANAVAAAISSGTTSALQQSSAAPGLTAGR